MGALQPVIEVGQCLHGFRVTRITPLPELRLLAHECEHVHSGARLLHLFSPGDSENLFAVAFRTPPPDDTGLPHILEHCVLGGSRRFPVKDPFVEMLKRSMATFINAMTYPDKTVYPVASPVRDDFFNLVDVYVDAVFHPTISPETFKQEGFHYAFQSPDDASAPLLVRGIVYNEMKGEYSDPDSIIERESKQRLFPGEVYGRDSGGNPDHIPELEYGVFRDFHTRYYHPANAYIVVYGDIPTTEHLAFLQPRLDACEACSDCAWTAVPPASSWCAPRRSACQLPIGSDETPAGRAAVTVNWAVGPGYEPMFDLTMEVVDHLLFGNAGSPLRKALIDSHLGGDLTDVGYHSGALVGTFHAGLREADPGNAAAIEALVLRVLRQTVRDGFSHQQVMTAFQQLQYACREVQSNYPLRLMDWTYDSWLYDRDPLAFLLTGQHLERLHAQYERSPEYFQQAIHDVLLGNPHRMTVEFVPTPGLQHERETAETERLKRHYESLSTGDLAKITTEADQLERLQAAPNPPEALASLPTLRLSQVPELPVAIPTSLVCPGQGLELLVNDVFANGVSYVAVAFDLRDLPTDLWPYVPLFARLFTRLGAGEWDYVELSERVAGCTGGMRATPLAGTDTESADHGFASLCVQTKALDSSLPDALRIVGEIVRGMRVDNLARLQDMVLQARARLHAGILPDGSRYATTRAARTISPVAAIDDLWSGLPQVWLVDSLASDFARRGAELAQKLAAIQSYLADAAPRVSASFTGAAPHVDRVTAWLSDLGPRADVSPRSPLPDLRAPGEPGLAEGLAMASEVAFCGCCFSAPHFSDPVSVPLQVFAQLLSFDYLWEQIRVHSGAYGAFGSYNATAGVFQMSSFRDPNIIGTIDVFREVTRYISDTMWTCEEIERAAISSAKGDEKPIRPGDATAAALWRRLAGVTEEVRRRRRRELLHVTPKAVAESAHSTVAAALSSANVCVLADRDALDTANRRLDPPLQIENAVGRT